MVCLPAAAGGGAADGGQACLVRMRALHAQEMKPSVAFLMAGAGCVALRVYLDVQMATSRYGRDITSILLPLDVSAVALVCLAVTAWISPAIRRWWRYERRRAKGVAALRRGVLGLIGGTIVLGGILGADHLMTRPQIGFPTQVQITEANARGYAYMATSRGPMLFKIPDEVKEARPLPLLPIAEQPASGRR
jgi:hypothetical protein